MRVKGTVEEAHYSHDESGNESDRNNQKNNESSEEYSDYNSETDEKDCDFHRGLCLDTIMLLERHFTALRDYLYMERVTHLDRSFHEIRTGTSSEYVIPLNKLQQQYTTKMHIAHELYKARRTQIQNVYEAEELAVHQNFKEEKTMIYDTLYQELMEKIRKLEEDKCEVELYCNDNDKWSTMKTKSTTKNKPITVTGPYIVYNLEEREILEDWAIIRRAFKSTLSVS